MKKYCTEIEKPDGLYGYEVYGNSWDEAQANADLLGLGKVIGELIFRIPVNDDINPDDIILGLNGIAS